MDNIWEKALSVLQSEVNEQVYNAWFSPIRQASLQENTIFLSVPNKFFENWIREKYFSLIKAAILQASGKEMSIQFDVSETSSPPDENVETVPEKSGPAPVPAVEQREKERSSMHWLKSMLGGTRQMPESRYQEIGLNPKYTFDNFVVGSSNRFAHAAALSVCDNLSKSYNPLFIYGGVGLGKTHLMQAIGHAVIKKNPKIKTLYISSEEFTNQLISAIRTKTTPKFRNMYRNVDVLLIDDIQFIAGKNSTQEEFFHTFNTLYDDHKQIVLSSDRSPQEIPGLEERLVSRFVWGLIADIQPPDFETRIAIFEKKCENESVEMPQDVLFFLAEKIKTNIREMEGALIRVVAYAKLTGRNISVDLAKEVLKGMIIEEEKKISVDQIQSTVAGYFNMNVSDMKSKKRTRTIAYPRQMAMYLSRTLTDYSLPEIGEFFGGRDHSTVLHACDKIEKEISSNEETQEIVTKLKIQIKK